MKSIKKHTEYDQFVNLFELKLQEHPLELPIKHYFVDGMYAREIFIPQGVTLTSRVHLSANFFSVSMGTIDVMTDKEVIRIIAPYTGMSEKGVRRLGYAVEDTIFTTFHVNEDNCQDLDILEARLFKYYDNPLLESNKTMEEIQ